MSAFFSNFSSQSRRVAILFNNNFEFEIHKTEKNTNGNKLLIDITIEGKHVLLCNIYAPNFDTPQVFFSKKYMVILKLTVSL